MVKRKRVQRVSSETASHVEPKDESTQGNKGKAHAAGEPARKRPKKKKTESVNQPSECQTSEAEQQPAAGTTKSVLVSITKEEFEEKYLQFEMIGEGGFGTVYSGYRIEDLFPVAIKHIQNSETVFQPVSINGEDHNIPLEVMLMVIAAGDSAAVGKCAAISLLAWCNLGDEILLIMERPESCMDLLEYLDVCQMTEALAKDLMKQLVVAATEMHKAGVFHRDLKLDNILIEQDEARPVPRVRIIDFGCGCFVISEYHVYSGTSCYQPPEFYKQGTYEAAPTTVWQLGSILLELLSSNSDFITNKFHLSKRLLTKEIKELNVSNDCKNLLKKCLNFNPRQRIPLQKLRKHPWFTSSPL